MRAARLATLVTAAVAVALCATAAGAAELAGKYRVEGSNAGGTGRYRGAAAIVQTGDTYQMVWTIGRQQHRGTGLASGDTFSVVFQPKGGAAGVVVYKRREDGTLVGVWTGLGGKAVGTEILTPEGQI